MMWTIIFACSTVVCGIGWAAKHISVLALVYYIKKKGYADPSDAEIKECTLWAVKHLLGDLVK